MIYFTSDTHFGHKNIIKYEKSTRGKFKSVEEMNEEIIKNWNSIVQESDTVYVLGDMFMGAISLIDDIMPRLKGKIILIRGNHDTNARVDKLTPYCAGIYDIYNLKHNNNFYILCHYPMREWMHKEHGSIHLYGHVHSNEHRNGILSEPNSFHVGMDTNNLSLISIDEIEKKFSKCYHDKVEENCCLICGKKVNKYKINDVEVYI